MISSTRSIEIPLDIDFYTSSFLVNAPNGQFTPHNTIIMDSRMESYWAFC